MGDNNEAKKRLCERTNSTFPILNVTLNDLLNPTEAFMTRSLVHYLHAFGFRVEPPHNIGSDANDISKEKRLFLAKLCRQVERILQIQFPSKSYTYFDIIRPTIIKTFNTLDLFLNYYCFCKLHKQEILAPLNELIKTRETQADSIRAKQRELEKTNKRAAQVKVDIAKSEAKIKELNEKLPQVLAELEKSSKICKQKQDKFEAQHDEVEDIRSQVSRLKDLVLPEGELDAVLEEKQQVMSKIEEHKKETTKLEQLFMERRIEWENTKARGVLIEQLTNIIKPEMINDYTEKVKLTEHLKKNYAIMESKHPTLQTTKKKQQLKESADVLKKLKQEYEEDAHVQQNKIKELQFVFEQLSTDFDKTTEKIAELHRDIDKEHIEAKQIKTFVAQIFDKYEY